jgi:hypothetical protein
MSSGLLAFTLGLTTGGFTGPLATADAKLKGFVTGAIGLGAVIAGVQKALEKGAGLKQLSDQTGENIGNLYRLQQGFKAEGLDAGSVGTTLFMLNKALGGINDNGEPTAAVFSQMGLSIEQLKKLNAPQQLMAIAGQLNRLDASSATSAAGKIFGRYNAREFLQLSRNADEFADALRRGGVQAAIFDRYGRTFEKLEILAGQLKEKLGGIFVGIAAGIGPGLENILKMLNGIDLSKIGAGIGTFITALTQAFREGKLSEMIGESLKIGFEAILDFAPGIFAKVGLVLLKAFETPLEYVQARMEYIFADVLENGAKGAGRQFLNLQLPGLGVGDKVFGKPEHMSFEEFFKERKKEGVKFNLGSGEFGLDEANDLVNGNMRNKVQDFSKKWGDYWQGISDLASRAPQPDASRNSGIAAAKDTFGSGFTIHHTALEKMGFVFRGGAGSDPQVQTARNTAKMATTLQSILNKMGGTGSFQDNLSGASAI